MTRLGKFLCGTFVVGAAVLAWGRFAPMPADRVAALKLLDVPMPPVEGRDGSDALWLLGHDVPAGERAAVAAQVRRHVDAMAAPGGTVAADPLRAYPRFADDRNGLCELNEGDCLEKVRSDPAATAATLAAGAKPLAAARELVGFDGLRHGVVPSLQAPMPQLSAGRQLAYTALAERFVRGEREAAIADTCNDLAGWRRLGADNDMLIAAVVGASFAAQDLRLLARMLGEMPADAPLPPECTPALAATTPRELDLCPAMRNEFALVGAAIDTPAAGDDPWPARAFAAAIDRDHAAGVMAPAYAHFCDARVRELALADRRASELPAPVPECGPLEGVAHAGGCLLAALAPPAFDKYLDRRTDLAAQLALMRTWLWLRAQDPAAKSWPALLPARPAGLGLRREASVSADGTRLEMPLLDTRKDSAFALALPAPAPAVAAP